MKIVGVGLNRTGTTTLGVCLDQLGYKHTSAHQQAFQLLLRKEINALMQIVAQYDSFEDWPWPLLYRQIDIAFPGSKFILTRRQTPERWYESLCKLAEISGPTEYRRIIYGHAMPQGHKDEYLALYEKHNRDVKQYFSDKPGSLLEVCWEDGDGWEALCSFLGTDIPDIPFPHVNRSDRLAQIVQRRESGSHNE